MGQPRWRNRAPDPLETAAIERFVARGQVTKCPPSVDAPRLCDGCREVLPRERFDTTEAALCKRCRRDAMRKAGSKRSALERGSPVIKVISPMEIFRRDGWICGICGAPIDENAEYPNPVSVSLDHILAAELGGEHAPDNLQAAHLGCNLKKGRKLELRKARKKSRYSGSFIIR